MAKLSASALRTAAANAREKNVENAVMSPALHEVAEKNIDIPQAKAVEPEPEIIEEKRLRSQLSRRLRRKKWLIPR